MLGLADQIHGHNHRIGGFIGNHHGLGRTCKYIDTDFTKKHSFGFGNIGIPGTYENVSRFAGKKTECHGGNRLNSAKGQNGIGFGQGQRIYNCRIDTLSPRRRACYHKRYSGRLGRCHAHYGRSGMGKTAAWNVAPGTLAGD